MYDVTDTSTVVEQAEVLRERVIRTAWALHFAAGNAAALCHDLAEAGSELDDDGERWWTEVSKQAIDLVHSWDAQARAVGRL